MDDRKRGVTLVDYYDMWEDDDGFFVNDVMRYERYCDPMTDAEFASMTDAEIVALLKVGNGPNLKPDVKPEDLYIEHWDNGVEIWRVGDSMLPLFRLELDAYHDKEESPCL